MVDLQHLRETIASADQQASVAAVTTKWLREVHQDLQELEQRRLQEQAK